MMMSVDEVRKKWEAKFWSAFYSARQVGDHGSQMLARVMKGIAADGYYVDVITSAQDPSLTGLAFHELPSETSPELSSLTLPELNCMSGLKRKRVRVTLEVVANLVVGGEDAEDRKDAVRMMIEDGLADSKPLAFLEDGISSVAVRRIEEEA